MSLGRTTLALCALVALSGTLRADTLDVPGTYATIQAAIDAASPGDTVLVAPGGYFEIIDFLGKAITVESSGGASATTIVGLTGSVVTFANGEGNDSVLRGFTLSGGIGTGAHPLARGGGIYINGAAPTIEECNIDLNRANEGGGVWVEGNLPTEPARLVDCLLIGNSALKGGGFAVFAGSLDVEGCTIHDNFGLTSGGGGAIYDGGSPTGAWQTNIEHSWVTGNGTGGLGAGLSIEGIGLGKSANVSNCVIADNTSSNRTGGIHRDGVSGTTTFCTITGNSAPTDGGLNSASPSVGNCIIWGNTGGEIGGTTSTVLWCDVQGGYPGTGNIDVDPFFVDAPNGDYHLAPTSACQDAGNPSATGTGTDCDGDPRLSGTAVDIGADEATFPKGPWTFRGHALAGASGTPAIVGTGTALPGAATTVTLSGTAPLSPTTLVLGASWINAPCLGGVMVPGLDILVGGLATDGTGSLVMTGTWPPLIPSGFTSVMQFWMSDASGPLGYVASNGLTVTAP